MSPVADVLRRPSQLDTGIGVFTGSFIRQAGTGNQDILLDAAIVNAMNAGPFVIRFSFIADRNMVSGTWYGGIFGGEGYVAKASGGGITQECLSFAMGDNVATSDTAKRVSATAICCANTAAATMIEGSYVSNPDATHMRLNWAVNSGTAGTVNYMIITGLTDAKVLYTRTGAPAGTKSLTGAGFQGEFAFISSCAAAAGQPSNLVGVNNAYGWVNKHGQQGASGFASGDGQATAEAYRGQRSDACIAIPNGTSWGWLGTGKFTADGIDMVMSTAIDDFIVIACIMDGISSDIEAFTRPNSSAEPTAQTINPRPGFLPKGIMFATAGKTPSPNPVTGGAWALGMTDLTNERAIGMWDDHLADPTQTDSVWFSGKALHVPGHSDPNGVSEGEGSVTSVTINDVNLNWTLLRNPSVDEVLCCILGDDGTDTYPMSLFPQSGISATSNAHVNQKKVVELSTGRLVTAVLNTSNTLNFWYDTDGEGNFQSYFAAGAVSNVTNWSIDSYVDSSGDEFIVLVKKSSSDNFIYTYVGKLNSGLTDITWSAASLTVGSASRDFPDVTCFSHGTGGKVFISVSVQSGALNHAEVYSHVVDASGSVAAVVYDYVSANHGVALHTWPSIDYDPITKRIFLAWSAGTTGAGKGLRFTTAPLSGGAWGPWATEVEVDSTKYVDHVSRGLVCRWDGIRVVIGYALNGGGSFSNGKYESTNLTSFTATTFITHSGSTWPDGWFSFGMAVTALGDIYFMGRAYSDYAFNVYKWTRATATLTKIVANDSAGATIGEGYHDAIALSNGDIGYTHMHGASAPYSVKYNRILV